MLDQQVAAPRLVTEQRTHVLERPGVDLPALRVRPDPVIAFLGHAPLSANQATASRAF
jgi:hypothetical protein